MLMENNKYKTGDVINIKLVSGDEIVGELVTQNKEGYELRKPCIVVTSPDGIGLIQAMFGLDPDLENLLYKDQHVVTICKTHDKMHQHYLTVTSV